ncbi:lysozyme inhibitor LprI family protein [Sphingosinicella rhizophila]|uniref:Lysozyme inhibitor LprI family protein n=1 Tax=Sphingosinicella rhizophila TaxID=3050082 RepID=A0ABU3Q5J6_9SPHN|nr:lysozyme inhibitor LprI family protein [Sphingosinicella sp. GR2756]MDT9598210.1 lysozyme inhibitor LprI family protein [Sphingosinicella sp. GR2756]
MISILILAAVATAQTPYEEHHCDEPMAQQDMNACAQLDFEAADKELNLLWRDVIGAARQADKGLDRNDDTRPTHEAALRAAQRAWIQFRDAHCTYEGYEMRGGSMEPMLYSGCRARLTRARIAELKPTDTESR